MSNRPSSSAPAEQEGAQASPAFTGLVTRVISGLVYVGLFIGSILFGSISTAVFVALISVLSSHEFFQMVKRDGKVPNELLGDVAAFLFPIAALGESTYLSALIFLLILAVGLWYVYSPRTRITDVAATLMGPLYTGFMLSAITLPRDKKYNI